MWTSGGITLVLAAGMVLAQRAFSPSVVEDGKRLFITNCEMCHGPEGDGVSGVDFGHNKFRRASSDEDIVKIIKNGIPGTGMPPHNFADFAPGVKSAVSQVESIVVYLHYMAAASSSSGVTQGDAAGGKAIFEGKGGCLSCHRVKGNGSRLGPELTDVGAIRRSGELESSILDPDAEVLPRNRFFRVVTRDGATTTGRLLNQDAFSVQLFDANERMRSFVKSDLREAAFVAKSPMPSYRGKLSSTELADLIAYLRSLKGIYK